MAGPTHLLDTSVFSQPVKNDPLLSVKHHWESIGDEALCTSAICLAKLKQGLTLRNSAVFWNRYRALLENHYPVFPFDEPAADTYAELVAALKKIGKPKPTIDLMIAATAKSRGLILATLNVKDFKGIPGLAVEDWSR